MRRIIAAAAIGAMTLALPLGPAEAGNKGGGNFCPGRDNNCPSNGGGGNGGGGNGNTGNKVDECDNKSDGTIVIIGGVAFQCNNFDVGPLVSIK